MRIVSINAECPIKIFFCPMSIAPSTHIASNFVKNLATRSRAGSKSLLHPFTIILAKQ